MTESLAPSLALLPAGLRDLLPSEAETEAASVAAIMDTFTAHGYQRVKPPLLEFEDGLLAGTGSAMGEQTFRLMDPDSHRMMGLRADMTPQVARIATTRLGHWPRPLRVSYAGQCLRVQSAGLAAERQVAQAGIELIGHDSPEADAEIVRVGAEALAAVGLTNISFDLTLPPFVPTLLEGAGLPVPARAGLIRALDRKDAVAVAERGGALAGTLTELLLAAGPADRALEALLAATLPPGARALAERLAVTVATIHAHMPGLRLTVDPVEFRGLRYHTGVSFSVFAPGHPEELARGGRYLCGLAEPGEPATGLTLYPDAVLRAAPPKAAKPRVFLAAEADPDTGAELRAAGYATVAGLDPVADPAAEARRLGCAFYFGATGLVALSTE